MTYTITYSVTSVKFLDKLERKDAEKIIRKIKTLEIDPFAHLKRLHGEKFWRLQVNKYRAIVDVVVTANQIFVVRIGYRKNVYD